MPSVTSLTIAPAVRGAVASGAAVVALESAVITHGLPKAAAMDAVRQQWAACMKANVTPAVVGVFEGQLRVGLTIDECAALAGRTDAVKVSPWNLAAGTVSPGFGGTTVAATMVAATRAGIRVVSTGGIGGVHPGDGQDVSSDLTELGRQPVCVVCAGPKSTLDAGATLERLETLGVPVIGWPSSSATPRWPPWWRWRSTPVSELSPTEEQLRRLKNTVMGAGYRLSQLAQSGALNAGATTELAAITRDLNDAAGRLERLLAALQRAP